MTVKGNRFNKTILAGPCSIVDLAKRSTDPNNNVTSIIHHRFTKEIIKLKRAYISQVSFCDVSEQEPNMNKYIRKCELTKYSHTKKILKKY